ncbi:MAG TPA: fumarylacetoacetate hydrolase family protein [Bryobacteraceae bacterium]|nr:fumarylacetoacetate hydrolase family protein [Bryobacteraceae bacterium]
MRFITFHSPHGLEPGVMIQGQAVGLRGAGFENLLSIIAGGAEARDRVTRWLQSPPTGALPDMTNVQLHAPLARPPKIICIGLNYRDHAAEGKMSIPEVPTVFCKFATSIIGPGDPIVLPRNSTKPDYEAEFVVVIGKRGRHIPEEKWRDYVFGYSILNDVSARDFQMATTQWTMGKTFDTFAPFGPEIVTADEIDDPHNLAISLTLNGETMQSSNTGNMIFQTPRLIAFLSSVFTLEPGDIISTGTPAGVGFARKPPRWLRPGDEVTVRVEGLGELTNPVVAEA